MKTFRGKVAVITGAGSGIGRALACALAAEGARLALSDINAEGLADTVRQLPPGTDVHSWSLDVSSREAVMAYAETVAEELGGAHYLFNNAGTTLIGTFENQSIDEIRWLLDINLGGVLSGTKAFLPIMLSQREGCIVNMSSIAGLMGMPALSSYNIAKFAVRGMTESLWSELEGTGVRAMCIHPGGIRTNIDRASRRCATAGEMEARMDAVNKRTLRTPPERCAADILKGIRRGKRRVVTGYRASSVDWLARLLPDAYPALFAKVFGF